MPKRRPKKKKKLSKSEELSRKLQKIISGLLDIEWELEKALNVKSNAAVLPGD